MLYLLYKYEYKYIIIKKVGILSKYSNLLLLYEADRFVSLFLIT